ncbi:MAG: DUF2924 domain-containing protein [Novosphingobium sp.]
MPEQIALEPAQQADEIPVTAPRRKPAAPSDLYAELAALSAMSLAQMRVRWTEHIGQPAPRVRSTLLRLALAFELQATVYGGLTRRCEQRLAWLAGRNAPAPSAAPGTRLLREWNGVLHTVTIAEDGTIHWNGKSWRSLSEVARAITGTRWSGPVFFGLKARSRAA